MRQLRLAFGQPGSLASPPTIQWMLSNAASAGARGGGVGALAVVDVKRTADGADPLHAVREAGVGTRGLDLISLPPNPRLCASIDGRSRVFCVVRPLEAQANALGG